MSSEDLQTETKRDRVRRFLIEPAQDKGMRFPKRMPEAEQRKVLDRLCDSLSYMTDEALQALAAWAVRHGDGSDRSFWPPVVGLISMAEAYQPRALEEVPGVASWFGSRAGPAARAEGRLVAEFLWWQKHKRPPLDDRERKLITDKAATLGRDVQLADEAIERGVEPGPETRRFLQWYRSLEGRADALVQAGEAKRAGAEDAA